MRDEIASSMLWLVDGAGVGAGIGYFLGLYKLQFYPPSVLPWFVMGMAIAGGEAVVIFRFVDSARGSGRP